MTRLAVIALIVCFAWPSVAEAGWKMDRATAIARVVWHHPCVDRMTIRWGITRQLNAAAYAARETCAAVLNVEDRVPWPVFCTNVLHEAGHLAGMDHTRRGVMQAETVFVQSGHRWLGSDPRCARRGRPYLERHGLLATSPQTRT
jgi:hypothetical protein